MKQPHPLCNTRATVKFCTCKFEIAEMLRTIMLRTIMLLVIVSLIIHYYVITYDHVITEMNNENAMCQRESSQFE